MPTSKMMKTIIIGLILVGSLLSTQANADSCDAFRKAALKFMQFDKPGEKNGFNGCVNVAKTKSESRWTEKGGWNIVDSKTDETSSTTNESTSNSDYRNSAGTRQSLYIAESLKNQAHKRASINLGNHPLTGKTLGGRVDLDQNCKITHMVFSTADSVHDALTVNPKSCEKIKNTSKSKDDLEIFKNQEKRAKLLSTSDVYSDPEIRKFRTNSFKEDQLVIVRLCDAFEGVFADTVDGGGTAESSTTSVAPVAR